MGTIKTPTCLSLFTVTHSQIREEKYYTSIENINTEAHEDLLINRLPKKESSEFIHKAFLLTLMQARQQPPVFWHALSVINNAVPLEMAGRVQ